MRQKKCFFAIDENERILYSSIETNLGGIQMKDRDPGIFIRKSLENAVDAGDMTTAMEMSRLMDEIMLRMNRQEEEASGNDLNDSSVKYVNI